MRHVCAVFLVGSLLCGAVYAGPFPPAAGQPGSTAISKDSPSFIGWAVGFQNYSPGPNVDAAFKLPSQALGPASGVFSDVVSLGDSGSITLTFGRSIVNGPGADFAVFENSFSDTFLEFAWVEVSSNGTQFFRFPGFSLTPNPVGAFGTTDPTNIDGLAGKYRGGFGTPFDLDVLKSVPGLDVNDVRFVRIVDIVGNGTVFDNYPVQLGGPHPIYDPYPTVLSGGFDLDAVGVIHAVPEPGAVALLGVGLSLLLFVMLRRKRRARGSAGNMSANRLCKTLASAGLAALCADAGAVVSTFEDLPLPASGFFFPAATTTFTTGLATFNHRYSDFGIPGCCWDGWSYSNRTDTTTPGSDNQYSAYAGSGAGGSAQYGVAFFGEPAVTFATPSIVSGGYFTNTTYAALAMLNGDAFSKKFGGASGNDPDFFKLTITGKDASGATTGSVDLYLADYRFSDNSQDFVLKQWKFVDLSSLGAVSSLAFALDSSDKGQFGINTPGYFALDDLSVTAVPEPGSALMLLAGGLALLIVARRKLSA